MLTCSQCGHEWSDCWTPNSPLLCPECGGDPEPEARPCSVCGDDADGTCDGCDVAICKACLRKGLCPECRKEAALALRRGRAELFPAMRFMALELSLSAPGICSPTHPTNAVAVA